MGNLRLACRVTAAFCAFLGFGCSDPNTESTTPVSSGGTGGASTESAGGSQASAAGGTGGTGGAATTGGSASGGAGGANGGGGAGGSNSQGGQAGGPHISTECPTADQGGPGAVGVWENITPPEVCLDCDANQNGDENFGTASIIVNPQNPAVVYLGTEEWGFWKSTDCGTTWTKTNTGEGGDDIDAGSQWTMLVDPVDPEVVYTNSGFGISGIFKSTDGGVSWKQVLTPDVAALVPYGGFMGTYSMDPDDHLHVLASFHAGCQAPMTSACFVETTDGGDTWAARNGDPSWDGGEHTILEFLSSTTWLFGNADALWRSTDSGTAWTQIPGEHSIVHHQQLYRPEPGVYFQTTLQGLLYSNDDGANWELLQGSPVAAVGVVGTGDTVFTSMAGPWASPGVEPHQPYYSVSEADPTAQPMVKVDTPMMRDGGLFMSYDPDHHIVYSSNFPAGVWRAVVSAP